MNILNITSFFVICFILCEQIAAQAKILEEDIHEESIHSIENNENTLRKTKENVDSEKSKFEIPPLKYTKNEYEYKPVDKQNLSNTTNRNEIAENVPKIVIITRTPQETFKNVKKKDIERTPTETVKPRTVNSKMVESSELQRTHQLETSFNNPYSHNNKVTDHVDHNHDSSSDSNISSGNSKKHIKEYLKKVCPESESSHNLKSVPVEKDPQHMKIEQKTDSVTGRANNKKGKVSYFEEIDTDKDHSETSSDSVKSKPVFKVQKADSDNTPTSCVSEDPEKAIVSPKINTGNVEPINSKNMLPEVPTDQHLKSVILTKESNSNKCDRNADPELLTTFEKPDFYEENNLNHRLQHSSNQDDQEKTNLINLIKSTLGKTIGQTDDIVVKTYNVNELTETYKTPDESNDKKFTSCDNSKDSTDDINTVLHYVLEPKTALDTQYRYVETAQYVPPYSNNYQRNKYDQNSIPQQNYYYNILAPQYHPYKIYSQEYRGQSYYPKATGAYYAYPSPSEYNNQFKPDYTYAAPSYKYPFEDQLQDKVEPTNNNYITNWNTRNYQNQPGMYSNYYQPLVYDFSKVKNSKEYFDRTWRMWKDTEIQIKGPRTKVDVPCNKCGCAHSNRRKINNGPLTYLNYQRKNVIGGNGYY